MRLLTRIKRKASLMLGRPLTASTLVDEKAVEGFLEEPSNLALVSYPRTGSHWLRMLMELYFERPVLRRAFYYPDRTDYLAYHTHDVDLDFQRENVIYLYRDPVDTVYSQLRYHEDPPDSRKRIAHWADQYGGHLNKWLFQERFTTHKTVLTYEGMKRDLRAEFAKVLAHMGLALDAARLNAAAERVSRDEVKRKTLHDSHVVDLRAAYERERARFRATQSDFVWKVLLRERARLSDAFPQHR